MKVVDISQGMPSIDVLEEAIKDDDAVLIRNGHVVMLLKAFDDEDLADWQFEHDPELVTKTRHMQTEVDQGNYVTLDELDRELDE